MKILIFTITVMVVLSWLKNTKLVNIIGYKNNLYILLHLVFLSWFAYEIQESQLTTNELLFFIFYILFLLIFYIRSLN